MLPRKSKFCDISGDWNIALIYVSRRKIYNTFCDTVIIIIYDNMDGKQEEDHLPNKHLPHPLALTSTAK